MIDHRAECQKFCQTIDGYIAQLQALVLSPSQASHLVLDKLTEVGRQFKDLAETITRINIEKTAEVLAIDQNNPYANQWLAAAESLFELSIETKLIIFQGAFLEAQHIIKHLNDLTVMNG